MYLLALAFEFVDYAPDTIGNPLNGTRLLIYNLNVEKRGLVDILDTNSNGDSNSTTAST